MGTGDSKLSSSQPNTPRDILSNSNGFGGGLQQRQNTQLNSSSTSSFNNSINGGGSILGSSSGSVGTTHDINDTTSSTTSVGNNSADTPPQDHTSLSSSLSSSLRGLLFYQSQQQQQQSPPSSPIRTSNNNSFNNGIIRLDNTIETPTELEPEELMLYKLPIILPCIPNSIKETSILDKLSSSQDKVITESLQMIDVESIHHMVASYRGFLQTTTTAIGEQQDNLNKKIKEMEILCSKGNQLMVKHVTIMRQVMNTLPDVNKLNQNLKETQINMDNVLQVIDRLTKLLPNQDEELQEFSESLKKSPICRPNFTFKEPESISILKNVTNIIQRAKDRKSIWIDEIIPKMDTLRDTGRVKELVRKGIDKDIRGLVWQTAIGNNLNITQEFYEDLVQQSQNSCDGSSGGGGGSGSGGGGLDQSPEDGSKSNSSGNNSSDSPLVLGKNTTIPSIEDDLNLSEEAKALGYSLSTLEADLPRTFTSFSLVNRESSEFRKQLKRILRAYSVYSPYVQGMTYIAANLLLHMDEYHSFVCFTNLLNNRFLQSLFQLKMKEVDKYMKSFETMFSYCLPRLSEHFNRIGLVPHYYLIQWWMSGFCQGLPLPVATRIWDCFIVEGNLMLFVVALGILSHYRRQLEENNLEYCKTLLSNLPQDLDADSFFKTIDTINIAYCSHTFKLLERKGNINSNEVELLSLNSDDNFSISNDDLNFQHQQNNDLINNSGGSGSGDDNINNDQEESETSNFFNGDNLNPNYNSPVLNKRERE